MNTNITPVQPDGTPRMTGRTGGPPVWKQALWGLGALAALIVLIVALAHTPSGSGSSDTAPSTPQQVAQALVGTGVENSLSGQDTHETVKVAEADGPFTSAPGGGRQFRCDLTLSDGKTMTAEVTVWADGSVGWHQVIGGQS